MDDTNDLAIRTKLISGHWTLSRQSGVLSSRVQFLDDGTVSGYDNINERGWSVESDTVIFRREDGAVTSRLARVTPGSMWTFSGRSLVNPSVEISLSPTFLGDPGRFPSLTRLKLSALIEKNGWDIGDHTYGSPSIFETGSLTIGKYCSIAGGVCIALGNHRTDTVSSYPFAALER